jgi:hypothetical protein
MGFFDGWGTVADQLAEYLKTIWTSRMMAKTPSWPPCLYSIL